jgi:imidazolonepropionase-like amidohydrolase
MRIWNLAAVLAIALAAAACQTVPQPGPASDLTAIIGATVIDGASGSPIQNAVLVIEGDTIRSLGAQGSVEIPANARRIDATGKTIMPGIFNLHGHVALSTAMERGFDHHTRANIQRDANAYLYFGVTHTTSLGINGEAMESFVADQQAGRAGGARVHSAGLGFAAKDGFRPAGDVEGVHRPATPDEARAMVLEEVTKGVNLIKIWVDDAGGRFADFAPELYGAVIDEAHQHGLKVLAHLYALDDAKELMRRGIDALAHNVRDKEVDEEFLTLAKEHGVTQISVLVGAKSSVLYAEEREFLDDPALPLLFPSSVLDAVRGNNYRQSAVSDAQRSRRQYEMASRNTAKVHRAGIPIAVGTDSQGAGRFQGLWEHIELELLVEAGLTPMEAIQAATANGARFLSVENRFGTLEPGKVADFLILNSDPLSDISNSRDIDAVWMNGQPVDRDSLVLRGGS